MTVFSWQVALAYFILAPFIGGFMTGLDRKISARMQGRRGPSVLQPFYDVSKLMQKETKMVNHLQQFMVSGFLVFVVFTGALFFWGGDLLLVFFSLTLAGIFYVLTASCANAPFSSLAAQRELREETGYTADEWIHLGVFYPAPAYSDELIHVYIARKLKKGERDLDEDEFLDIYEVPLDELVDGVMNGEITDCKTQMAILKTKIRLTKECR